MTTFLQQLDWRFATKQFDTTKTVSESDLSEIMRAIRMAPTSFGLQPFHVYVIPRGELREKMLPVSYNQPQVTDASHILVFAARTDMMERIENMMATMSGGDADVRAGLAGYEGMMTGMFSGMPTERTSGWAARQAYIAMGFALAACAEMNIDSCAMEGFSPADVDAVLELPEHMKSVAYLSIGYRAAEPTHPKFRFSNEDLFTTLD